jgi:hypothetical protein
MTTEWGMLAKKLLKDHPAFIQPDWNAALPSSKKLKAAMEAFAKKQKGETAKSLQSGFPEPPAGEEWHNPDELSPEQVGVNDGWRLLLESETQEDERVDYIELWSPEHRHFTSGKYYPTDSQTFRTKRPLPSAVVSPAAQALFGSPEPSLPFGPTPRKLSSAILKPSAEGRAE